MADDARFEPREFAQSFQRCLEWAAGPAAGEDGFAARLAAHFGESAAAFAVTRLEAPEYDRANVQAALDAYLAAPARSAELRHLRAVAHGVLAREARRRRPGRARRRRRGRRTDDGRARRGALGAVHHARPAARERRRRPPRDPHRARALPLPDAVRRGHGARGADGGGLRRRAAAAHDRAQRLPRQGHLAERAANRVRRAADRGDVPPPPADRARPDRAARRRAGERRAQHAGLRPPRRRAARAAPPPAPRAAPARGRRAPARRSRPPTSPRR